MFTLFWTLNGGSGGGWGVNYVPKVLRRFFNLNIYKDLNVPIQKLCSIFKSQIYILYAWRVA